MRSSLAEKEYRVGAASNCEASVLKDDLVGGSSFVEEVVADGLSKSGVIITEPPQVAHP